jgi:hypothetical protein
VPNEVISDERKCGGRCQEGQRKQTGERGRWGNLCLERTTRGMNSRSSLLAEIRRSVLFGLRKRRDQTQVLKVGWCGHAHDGSAGPCRRDAELQGWAIRSPRKILDCVFPTQVAFSVSTTQVRYLSCQIRFSGVRYPHRQLDFLLCRSVGCFKRSPRCRILELEVGRFRVINLGQHAISPCHTANPQLGEQMAIKSMDSSSFSAVCEAPGF